MDEDKHLHEPGGDFQCLHEFLPAARKNLSDHIWGYLVGAAESETTLRRNRMAIDSLALRPRVCVDVSKIDSTTKLFGKPWRIPVFLSPVGSLESFDAGGAATAGRAAAAFGAPIMCSSVTHPGLEEIAAATPGPKIFQLYVRGDTAWVNEVVKRAVGSGYDAFAITVDTAAYSRRERDITSRFVKPWRAAATGHADQASFTWDNVKAFKDKHEIPLILKGIATGEDAALCCEHGVDGVYVSNHGGRQLDHGRGSLDVLPEVMAAVRGRAKVLIDGSFCRGTDVVKAIALGADAVGMGRMYCYALAADGAAGVQKMLELVEHEIGVAMALSGARTLAELNPSYIFRNAPIVAQPHQHSAFPLLQDTPEYRG